MRWRSTGIKGVPDDLKAALAEEALRRRTNVADVIVTTLGDHFAIDVPSSARRKAFRPSAPYGSTLVIRVPEPLILALERLRPEWRTTRSGVALKLLADAFGVEYEPPVKVKA